MKTPNWKYQLGEMVQPIVQSDYEHASKMIITAKVIEEYEDHQEQYYICSHYKLGDYIRQRLFESEIVKCPSC